MLRFQLKRATSLAVLMSSWRDFANDKEWSWLRIYDAKSGQWLELQERFEEGGLFELVVKSSWPTKVGIAAVCEFDGKLTLGMVSDHSKSTRRIVRNE